MMQLRLHCCCHSSPELFLYWPTSATSIPYRWVKYELRTETRILPHLYEWPNLFFFEISRIFEFFFEESEALILVKLFGYSYSKTKFTMRSLQLATGVSRTVIGKSGCGF